LSSTHGRLIVYSVDSTDSIQYETLRLHGPVVMMPRFTGNSPQQLTIKDKDYVLPARTSITINFAALHTHTDYWGVDALVWRPSRWLEHSKPDSSNSSPLLHPFEGSFVPWNHGPRVCPGRRFSQVEFVRLLFTLFANGSRVELVPDAREGFEGVRARALRTIAKAKVEVTLKMTESERIKLRWTKAKSG
jgi:cytochrome P450